MVEIGHSSMSDGGLNSFLFSTPEMSSAFSPQAQLRAMTRFEWALSSALEAHGFAEPGAGAVLKEMLSREFIDVPAILNQARSDGNIAIPFVRQLTSAVALKSEAASRSVHLGATSQDLLDTGLVLETREGLHLIETALVNLDAALLAQVKAHSHTVMLGRTWLQPGPPVTLGLKLAGTLAALRRARKRVRTEGDGALVLQFGGAVGTLASLGESASAISSHIAQLLELNEAALPWHAHRDRLVAVVQMLAILTGTLAKLGADIALLMQAEVGEVTEGGDDRGSSSTMPHKRNPVACAALRAIHAKMPGLAATMLLAMPQEHERGLGLWQAEWETVPEAFRLASASIAYAIDLANNLKVYPERMLANADAILGLPLAEAASSALAAKIGRTAAHELLRRASAEAAQQNRQLSEVLKEKPEVTVHIAHAEIDRLLDPHNYLGSSERFIARVVGDEIAYG
jgi:3-carboxy-cis,cis-muconate cycloisomerase